MYAGAGTKPPGYPDPSIIVSGSTFAPTRGRWLPGRMLSAATWTPDEALRQCASGSDGLTTEEADRRLEQYGPNEIAAQPPLRWPTRLLRALRNPLVILLSVLALISLATGDIRSAGVMAVMVVFGVGLRFMQESRADRAAAAFRAMIPCDGNSHP